MRIPKLAETRLYEQRTDAFKGVRRVGEVRNGEFEDAVNLTNDEYPYLTTRGQRYKAETKSNYSPPYEDNNRIYGLFQTVSGQLGTIRRIMSASNVGYVYINGLTVTDGSNNTIWLTDAPQNIVMMGAYVLFFPSKKYINTAALGTPGETSIVCYDCGTFTCPDMDIVMTSGNRLWGARFSTTVSQGVATTINEIYASKLGDFNDWTTGTTADAGYTASVGAPGYFTGACELNNRPVFFKEDAIISIYGTEPANFQVRTDPGVGVRLGCARTLCTLNGQAYYVGRNGVYVYGGGSPVCISENIDTLMTGGTDTLVGYDPFNCSGGAAVYDGKYYVSFPLVRAAAWRVWIYDTSKGTWLSELDGSEETTAVPQMIQIGDFLYYYKFTDGQTVYVTKKKGTSASAEASGVSFAAITGKIGMETEDHKTLSHIAVRMKVGTGASVKYALLYDDEKDANEAPVWRDEHTITAAPLRTFVLSVRPRRCDHFNMRIKGTGDVTVYSVNRIYERGSDLQNHILG